MHKPTTGAVVEWVGSASRAGEQQTISLLKAPLRSATFAVPMKRVICLLVSVSIALFASGCGGDDDSLPETPVLTPTSEAPTDLSKEEFISQADGVCAEVNAAVGAVDLASTDAASQLGQKADLYEGMIERIRNLGQPDDDAGLSEILIAGDELVQAEKDAQLAAERGDDAGVATAEEDAASALASFQSAAAAYGFEECGQDPSASSTIPAAPGDAAPVVPAPTAPAPVAPAPPPAPPAGPSGGAGGASGEDTGGDPGGGNAGSGGIGPG